MSANPGIATRLREWTVERRPESARRRKAYAPGKAPVWYGATDPDGKVHEVCVREGHSFCLSHGQQCQAISAVTSRLLARELTLLPSRQEIEEPKRKEPHFSVPWEITDEGRAVLATTFCQWCDESFEKGDVPVLVGDIYVHSGCAPEARSDSHD